MIISVASGKGGTGKTTLISHLSQLYSQQQRKILLIDLDFGMSNTFDWFKGLYPENTIYDFLCQNYEWKKLKYKINDYLDFISIGCGKKQIIDISKENLFRIIEEIRREENNYDIVLLDLGAGAHADICYFLIHSDKILLVLIHGRSSLRDSYLLLKILKEDYNLSVMNKIYVVFNMEDNHKEAQQNFVNLLNTCHKYLQLNLKYLGNLRYNNKIKKAFDSQDFITDKYKHTREAKQIQIIGDILCQKTMVRKS